MDLSKHLIDKRSPERRPRKAAYALPALFTAGNLFLGYLSILKSFEGAMIAKAGELGPNQHFDLAALAIGIAVVLAHNVWVANWRVIITVFGWLAMLGGIFRIVYPQLVQRVGGAIVHLAAAPVLGGTLLLVYAITLTDANIATLDVKGDEVAPLLDEDEEEFAVEADGEDLLEVGLEETLLEKRGVSDEDEP